MKNQERELICKAVALIQQALNDKYGEDAAFEIKAEGICVIDDDGSFLAQDVTAETAVNVL